MLNFEEILKIVSSIQQINIQTMIVKHKFQLYKLLGYQIVRLPNFQVIKLLVTKLLVTKLSVTK